MKKAFSLIELLVSLIIISLVASAFVPIITKKFAKNKMTVKIADSKHGLMIYSNPGTYAYDIPEAIDKIYISGAGGGGGGAGASKTTLTKTFNTSSTFSVPIGVNSITFNIIGAGGGGGGSYAKITSDTACQSGSRRVPAVSDNGQDLCVTNLYPIQSDNITLVVNAQQECTRESCCWKGLPSNSIHTVTCTRDESLCYRGKLLNPAYPFPVIDYVNDIHGRYLTISELKRFFDMTQYNQYLGTSGLNLCYSGGTDRPYPSYIKDCTWYRYCIGAYSNNCMPNATFAKGGYVYLYGKQVYPVLSDGVADKKNSYSVICVRNLKTWYHYAGAGGNSGAKLENYRIDVQPFDVLEITIGEKGLGGSANRNGADGKETVIKHKRNGVLLAQYKAAGGLGGGGASADAHGAIRLSSSSSANNGCSHSSNCKNAIEDNNGEGYPGADNKGGKGAGNPNYATLDVGQTSAGVGYSATTYGSGGSGGVCARGIRTPANCQKGGDGANGKVDITYDIITPGGGGGAGANANEIEYKITSDRRIVFTVGKGGDGGASNVVGKAGSPTTVMENHIIFQGGSGGTFGVGGSGGTLQINSSKVVNPPTGTGLGQNGTNGKMLSDKNHGFDGGIGGTTFLGYFGGCGGGIVQDEDSIRACQTSSRKDGLDAKTHNAAKNEFGGSGGGGGGVTITNPTLGTGGSGSDGYIRIRWGE